MQQLFIFLPWIIHGIIVLVSIPLGMQMIYLCHLQLPTYNFLLATVQVSKLETPTATDMKHIDRKLKSCRDPSSHEKYCRCTCTHLGITILVLIPLYQV